MGEFRGNQHTDPEFVDYSYEELIGDVRELADELNKVPTTDDAMAADELPSLSSIYSISDDGWLGLLEDAGLEPTQVREYDESEKESMLHDIKTVASSTPGNTITSREYSQSGDYPTSVVKEHFGSWRQACFKAGVSAGNKHGRRCEGPQGETLESKREAAVAEWLVSNNIEYEVHPAIPDSDWVGDFYLPVYRIWIEVDGYKSDSRPNSESFREKIEYLRDQDHNVIVVDSQSECSEYIPIED